MGIKPEVPKTAFFIGKDRVNGRVIQEQHALARLALVVFVDGLDQGCGIGRRVALHDELSPVIDGRLERGHGFLVLALAVVARQCHGASPGGGPLSPGQGNATARVDTLHGPNQIAKDGFSRIGKWTAQALDHGYLDGHGGGLSHCHAGGG